MSLVALIEYGQIEQTYNFDNMFTLISCTTFVIWWLLFEKIILFPYNFAKIELNYEKETQGIYFTLKSI